MHRKMTLVLKLNPSKILITNNCKTVTLSLKYEPLLINDRRYKSICTSALIARGDLNANIPIKFQRAKSYGLLKFEYKM